MLAAPCAKPGCKCVAARPDSENPDTEHVVGLSLQSVPTSAPPPITLMLTHALHACTHIYTEQNKYLCILVGQARYSDAYTHCPHIYSVNVDLTSQKAKKLALQCHVLQLSSSPEILQTTKATTLQGILGHSTTIRRERELKDKRK